MFWLMKIHSNTNTNAINTHFLVASIGMSKWQMVNLKAKSLILPLRTQNTHESLIKIMEAKERQRKLYEFLKIIFCSSPFWFNNKYGISSLRMQVRFLI